jgi:hypothetical protein
MTEVRIESIEVPFQDRPKSAMAACQLLYRAEYLGLLDAKLVAGPLTEGRVRSLVRALASHGVASAAALRLTAPAAFSVSDEELSSLLSQVREQVADSPLPDSEWKPMREALGDELLARLLAVSPTSLRRYADGERTTPDAVAARLHTLAMITSDLAGGYNERGMRRWFLRPRAQLDGLAPVELMAGGFDPDSESVDRVRNLAAWLVGAGSAA